MKIIKRIKSWIGRNVYVTLDGRDNSVTMSRRLRDKLDFVTGIENKVFVLRLSDGRYAFVLNPKGKEFEDTQLNTIQENIKQHCIGFESLIPTVNRILQDYNLPCEMPCRLSVSIKIFHGIKCYIIEYGKHSRKSDSKA